MTAFCVPRELLWWPDNAEDEVYLQILGWMAFCCVPRELHYRGQIVGRTRFTCSYEAGWLSVAFLGSCTIEARQWEGGEVYLQLHV